MTQARGTTFFVFVVLAIAASAFAAKPVSDTPTTVITDVAISASAVQWQTAGTHERLVLTVGGPDGFSFSKEFASGAIPMLRLQDLGAKFADGSYTWELRAVPRVSAETRRKLNAARDAGDDVAAAKIRSDAGLDRDMTFSGAFTIANSAFVTNRGEEPSTGGGRKVTTNALKPAPNDQVYADDVIIQGSACVGLDCVNNESFGFDTIRLKENNTRIKFDDTSSSAGFPANDWQLTANDSASGGSSKFSIEDITGSKVPFTVTAGASTNSIFVDSTGRVGFRTSTPVLDLHVNTSNTPALRFEQNNSGGFTAQTWDIGANEANFFVRDVTGGSKLSFRIRPGAPTSSVDIASDGDVGIGTGSPGSRLDVVGGRIRQVGSAADTGYLVTNSGNLQSTTSLNPGIAFFGGDGTNSMYGADFGSNATTGRFRTRVFNGNTSSDIAFGTQGANPPTAQSNFTERMTIRGDSGNVGIGTPSPGSQLVIANGGTTSSINAGAAQFTVGSSRTFKENIAPVEACDILTKIETVPVVTYDFRNNGPKDRMGLIAEDFYKVFGRGDDKHIDGQDVQMALWLAVQKLTAENKELKDRLDKLEQQ